MFQNGVLLLGFCCWMVQSTLECLFVSSGCATSEKHRCHIGPGLVARFHLLCVVCVGALGGPAH